MGVRRMPTTYQSSSVVRSRVLTLATHDPIELVDITDAVAAFVRHARLKDGLVQVFSRHTTAAVRIQEDEPLLLEDLRHFLGRLAPPDDRLWPQRLSGAHPAHASGRTAQRSCPLPAAAAG